MRHIEKIVLLFSGQGAQYTGMGRGIYDKYQSARDLFAEADSLLGVNLEEICFDLPIEELTRSEYLQPAIFVISACCYRVLKEEKKTVPYAVCGFSLGEISALYAAGMLSFSNTLELVRVRGNAVYEAAESIPGAMCAVIGLADSEIERICRTTDGYVIPVNYNCPGQLVISGEPAAVEAAAKTALESGATRAVKLNTAGAFHTKLMEQAAVKVVEYVKTLNFSYPKCDFYSNLTGGKLAISKDEISLEQLNVFMQDYIPKQLSNPVRFSSEIQNLIADGAKRFIELGVGKTLSGFVKRIDTSRTVSPEIFEV